MPGLFEALSKSFAWFVIATLYVPGYVPGIVSGVCRVLKIEIPNEPTDDADLRNYAQGLSKLAGNEKTSRLLLDAIATENVDTFNRSWRNMNSNGSGIYFAIGSAKFAAAGFVMWFAHPLEPIVDPDLFIEFRETAIALGTLAEDEGLFLKTLEAYAAQDIDTVQDIVARLQLPCIYICRWLCITYCYRVCFILCPKIPRRFTVKDLQDFLVKWRALVSDPCALDELVDAIHQRDPELYASVVERFGYQRLCYFLCHWICFRWCRLYCYVICPPRLECDLLEPIGVCTGRVARATSGTCRSCPGNRVGLRF